MTTSTCTIQQALATDLRNQADWRYSLIARFPNDPRNERAGDRLMAQADEVEVLPDNDPDISALRDAYEQHGLTWEHGALLTDALTMAASFYSFDLSAIISTTIEEIEREAQPGGAFHNA